MNKSEIFKKAHSLVKSVIKTGDSYSATFSICLKFIFKGFKMASKFLVQEVKGYTFRLLNIETGEVVRAHKKEFKMLAVGNLVTADVETDGDLVTSMNIESQIVGDSTKARVEVCVNDVKVGDLVDGVPVVKFGQSYAKKGQMMAYAYFK